MANNQNLLKGKSTQFSSDNQPKNPGRKPSVLHFIKEGGLSKEDVQKIIGNLIWEYDPTALAAFLKDKKNPLPMGVTLILGALADDQKKRCLTNFEKLMDRSYGKATQNVGLNGSGNMLLTTMTPEERRKQIEEMLKNGEPKKPKS